MAIKRILKINNSTHFIYWNKICFNPFPNDNILDSSKLKEFADDSFKFDEMTESSLKG